MNKIYAEIPGLSLEDESSVNIKNDSSEICNYGVSPLISSNKFE